MIRSRQLQHLFTSSITPENKPSALILFFDNKRSLLNKAELLNTQCLTKHCLETIHSELESMGFGGKNGHIRMLTNQNNNIQNTWIVCVGTGKLEESDAASRKKCGISHSKTLQRNTHTNTGYRLANKLGTN